ncbi:cytosolic neutral trehalase [[Candida] jaroonii]|uniref:Cytosolic neutral trehalase n=1 Tax=[Candida] jaroonii TaxID=467808 RepID=A0ACA9YAN0_9ASCO|nr:cytosolic neutral trehalase [[Candida] jaroonii]
MNNPFKRSDSMSSDDDPFDVAESYYNNINNKKFNRVRTFSVFENNSKSKIAFNDSFIAERSNETTPYQSKSPTPLNTSELNLENSANIPVARKPEDITDNLRRPSILPIYDDNGIGEPNSTSDIPQIKDMTNKVQNFHLRRSSYDDTSFRKPKKFYISDIDFTLDQLLKNEDTDHNCQITIEDTGPKVLKLGTANSNGFNQFDIRGTYMLSNLLQELTIAKRLGKNQLILDEIRLSENPVDRMKRLISTQFWPKLTRRLTRDNIIEMSRDTKIEEEYVNEKGETIKNQESHRIYIPYNRQDQYEYFNSIKVANPDIKLDIQYLPEKIDARYIRSINKKPGLLALQSWPDKENPGNLINEPYVVPGGRFNEFYGWDSYMETLGLLVDVKPGELRNLWLAKGMAENFIYEINHYGKILNANRSYYLGRSQPPFLTDMALRIFNKYLEVQPEDLEKNLQFLERAVKAAIKEYLNVWTSEPRLDPETGLSCYHPEGIGIPPETEASHFIAVLKPYTEKYNVTHEEFIEMYNSEEVHESELDEYFLHDRAVRESGHDTSYRLEGVCAHLATVDLNSVLYKYEVDIAFIIESFFNNKLEIDGKIETKDIWIERAAQRKKNITKYLWNEEDSIFYDYNIKTKQQSDYESATTFWPLWSKVASDDQADKLVKNSIKKLEEAGGIVAGTLKSRGDVNLDRPSRQWDYPNGWAPQQILTWIGLANYGYDGVARRLVYRWLYLMTKAFADYNGVVVEKYNVVEGATPHKVDAEYGNQGADFKGVATEGFGWVNSSYVFGLTFLNLHAIRNLGALTPPKAFLENMHPSQRELFH